MAGLLVTVALLLTILPSCHAWSHPTPAIPDFTTEVTPYPFGVFRLRIRDNNKAKYEVQDVVVTNPLEDIPPTDSGSTFDFKHPDGSILSVAKDAPHVTFTSPAGVINFAVTKEAHAEDSIEGTATFPDAARLYGIPEHAVDMALQAGKSYRLMNLDVFQYKLDDTGGIYGSKPFMHAHGKKGTLGFFWMNSADTSVAVEEGWKTKWSSTGGIYDLFFIPGPSPKDVLSQYSEITGKMCMHPLFSLGYHQCRWNYRSEEDTLSVNEGFDKFYIPYDVIWLDIEHTDGKRYFTWDSHNFPNPERMINKIAATGRKVVTISDPHIKRASGYHVHDAAVANNYYVKTESGADYEGDCWPGTSSWLDFYNENVRNWYATLYGYDKYKGSTPDLYTWIDMNEPSVFKGHETTMDMNAVHTRADGFKAKHRDLHNMYGFYQTVATYQGHYLRSTKPPHTTTTRPFILSRSFFSGSQRYAAVWTGDNMAEWSHLEKSVPMLLSMSLAGLPFVGADVGGFFNNPETELLVRWYQLGTYYPFFRGHAHLETKRREPWLFGDEATDRIRKAIVTRYQLLPYVYTQFFQAHLVGGCVMQPLYFEFPSDERVMDIDRQFMLGPALMVKPVTAAGQTDVTYYLPGEQPWYHLFTGESYEAGKDVTIPAPLDYLPALIRGGYVIPKRDRVRRSSAAQANDPFTLVVALDNSGKAQGDLYIDDSHSFEYQTGAYIHKKFSFEGQTLRSGKYESSSPYATKLGKEKTFDRKYSVERVIVYGLKEAPKAAVLQQAGERTSLPVEWNDTSKVLTVPRPAATISNNVDWELTLVAEGDPEL